MKDKLFIAFQYLVPQHALSRMAGWLANTSIGWIKDPFTRWFVNRYDINMSEAVETDPCAYDTFNDFFTRALKAEARPICDEEKTFVCPADGAISQIGDIENGRIFQAKGQNYSLLELVGGDAQTAKPFEDGKFAVVYLSPRDYHRVHMPLAGTLKSMTHVPGDLFSVNDTTADNVPRLFARNERAVCMFDTEAGPMAVILVGAMIVASIETVWAGQVTPEPRTIRTTHYDGSQTFRYQTGEEMGRFKLGSTAIVLFGKDAIDWSEDFAAGSATLMGEKMGSIR
ncbi:phosphatidylserine decarboxylase [Aestuariicella hydrocarbonica]|uniref:Phosphatidylserine decarboxylase proenzyme n=1 Tax=Pseudomaricurvus hydrocarbonicus TaxID=1470433 RepID=A0A9E5MPV3_9GAMM|nr:archaetidylserine decarboxylase [Aestuariicella hydrocarbonica]NHO68112.1 phosphatidylserine decarboxylase [Aestuariicella hydrocarbonica]